MAEIPSDPNSISFVVGLILGLVEALPVADQADVLEKLFSTLDAQNFDQTKKAYFETMVLYDRESPFWKLFERRFPSCTNRTFSSKIGFCCSVLDRLWQRYRATLQRFKITKYDILWSCNMLAENSTWESLAANWGAKEATFRRRVQRTL